MCIRDRAYPVISEEEAPQDGPKVGFVDKLRLFDSGVKWVATKNKVDPEQETDAFGLAREQLTGRSRGRGASGAVSYTHLGEVPLISDPRAAG